MRRNLFGEPIAQPDDDITAIWTERFYLEDGDPLLSAMDICQEQIGFDGKPDGWSCTIEDEEGNMITVADFDSEADIVTWLDLHNVEVV